MKAVGIFVIKSVVFTLIFWLLWLYILRPITSTDQQNDNDALTKKYWEQAIRVDQLMDTSEKQAEQAASSIQKQEELLSRWEKVIENWEKNSPGR